MDESDPIEWMTVTVTCRVAGCPNENIPIHTFQVVGGLVQCGPCETLIDDIQEET